ncbi:hypothetical protein PR048_018704 [Dryococelus australis]|uniref:C2H2-type domain-containing protein n=1 Tax=Dryococelus australis TaxID=614101 RepID=A0ABQ9HDF9_9NEOP|nr:hypothetical protein PR048_018704 [Dryococelus australis]
MMTSPGMGITKSTEFAPTVTTMPTVNSPDLLLFATYKCIYCGKLFKLRQLDRRHEVFSKSRNARRHEDSCSLYRDQVTLSCEKCKSQFGRHDNLIRHLTACRGLLPVSSRKQCVFLKPQTCETRVPSSSDTGVPSPASDLDSFNKRYRVRIHESNVNWLKKTRRAHLTHSRFKCGRKFSCHEILNLYHKQEKYDVRNIINMSKLARLQPAISPCETNLVSQFKEDMENHGTLKYYIWLECGYTKPELHDDEYCNKTFKTSNVLLYNEYHVKDSVEASIAKRCSEGAEMIVKGPGWTLDSVDIYGASPEQKGGEMRDPRENPPTNMRKSGVTRPGIEHVSHWWEASRLTAEPPVELNVVLSVVLNMVLIVVLNVVLLVVLGVVLSVVLILVLGVVLKVVLIMVLGVVPTVVLDVLLIMVLDVVLIVVLGVVLIAPELQRLGKREIAEKIRRPRPAVSSCKKSLLRKFSIGPAGDRTQFTVVGGERPNHYYTNLGPIKALCWMQRHILYAVAQHSSCDTYKSSRLAGVVWKVFPIWRRRATCNDTACFSMKRQEDGVSTAAAFCVSLVFLLVKTTAVACIVEIFVSLAKRATMDYASSLVKEDLFIHLPIGQQSLDLLAGSEKDAETTTLAPCNEIAPEDLSSSVGREPNNGATAAQGLVNPIVEPQMVRARAPYSGAAVAQWVENPIMVQQQQLRGYRTQ